MAKYLCLFSSHSELEAYIGGGNYVKPFVGYDRESVRYEKLVIYKFLDILYADANGNKIVDSTVLDPNLGYTPIGLCIAKTGFFGTNEPARWMSLKYMNYTTPETGSLTYKRIMWGHSIDISTIDNIYTSYTGGGSYNYLTADWITGTERKIPSLFDVNGNWNLTKLGTVNQFAVTDIEGKNKTEKILETATAQSDWRTASTIKHLSSTGYTPAACCCARYHTLGTQAGDWYLGAGGEMSMIVVQKPQINNKLAEIAAVYNNDCISSLDDHLFWSSTEFNSGNIYFINTSIGIITSTAKSNSHAEVTVISMLQY